MGELCRVVWSGSHSLCWVRLEWPELALIEVDNRRQSPGPSVSTPPSPSVPNDV